MKEQMNLELSSYLKMLRTKYNLSQADIADKLGITRQCYTNWEREPIKLDLEKLIKIGKVMDEDILIFFNLYIAKRHI